MLDRDAIIEKGTPGKDLVRDFGLLAGIFAGVMVLAMLGGTAYVYSTGGTVAVSKVIGVGVAAISH